LCFDDEGEDWIWFEDFDNNNQGWTVGTEWSIGAATYASCSWGTDPGTDHTSTTTDNGVAGNALGGCINEVNHDYYCLTSEVFDTTSLSEVALTFWRWLGCDYQPYTDHKLDVWNGSGWITLFDVPCCSNIIDTAWMYQEFDITAYQSASTQVRWCFNVTNATSMVETAGWNIDDITIGPPGCFHEAFEKCGDGYLDPDEECDDGNGDNTDGCADDCTLTT
jgi:cysteine-rich repeat protein